MERWERKNWVALILLFSGLRVFLCTGAAAENRPQDGKAAAEGSVSFAAKTIIELQSFRETASIEINPGHSEDGLAALVNLNPNTNAWYLLRLKRHGGATEELYHLENGHPATQRLLLDPSHPKGLVVTERDKSYRCDLWGAGLQSVLNRARASGVAYAPLCEGRIWLRNPVKGHQTKIERVTDFLRDRVPGGEVIVGFVRDTVFRYIYQKKGEEKGETRTGKGLFPRASDGRPASALIGPSQSSRTVKPEYLGIETEEPVGDGVAPGAWYRVKDIPGVYLSLIVPNAIDPEILRSVRNVVSGLDNVEAAERVYLVAFDLERFDLRYALGTEHPRVGWSDHVLSQMKDASLPGPDGIGSTTPLVSTGLIRPGDEGSAVAAFTAGFKRSHGAFAFGGLALKNHGSHYGFIENGVVFSRLQPGLATLFVLAQGQVNMKTWTEDDNRLLPTVNSARQNGVPIITGFDQAGRLSVPGPLVGRWGEGNWSGSSDKKLRTMRAGAALQEDGGKRFLIYAFFWNATPSAMARVFQAYRCRYAMLLDMNALEHTYLAVYRRQGANLYVQHLIQGMSEVDLTVKGRYVPRFLGYSDDRDFFYLTQKGAP